MLELEFKKSMIGKSINNFRYTFQKISTKLYTEIPDVSRYTRLVSTQTQIVKDIVQNHRLSRSNQKKLEQNLKDIYR